MPRARRSGYRRSGYRTRTRTLEWDANEGTSLVATAAGVIRTLPIAFNTNTSPEVKVTIYRVVGTVSGITQADANCIWYFGVYRSINGLELNPRTQADQENWMYWRSFFSTTNAQGERAVNLNFDIKVKRVLDTGDQLNLSLMGEVAIFSAVNLRILSKLTGT